MSERAKMITRMIIWALEDVAPDMVALYKEFSIGSDSKAYPKPPPELCQLFQNMEAYAGPICDSYFDALLNGTTEMEKFFQRELEKVRTEKEKLETNLISSGAD